MSPRLFARQYHFVVLRPHNWDRERSPGGFSLRCCTLCGKRQVGHSGAFNAAESYWITAKPGSDLEEQFFEKSV